MGRLSDSLGDLAGRIRTLEESAAAVRERNRAALKARGEELEAALEREVAKAQRDLDKAVGTAVGWWSETKNAIEREIAAMRADFEKWQAGLREKNAERAAQDAENDAIAAVTLAGYLLDAAEWAVVRAELARAEADQLTTRS